MILYERPCILLVLTVMFVITWVDQRLSCLRLGSLMSVSAHPLVTCVKAKFRLSRLPNGPALKSFATSTSVDLDGRERDLGPPFSCCLDQQVVKQWVWSDVYTALFNTNLQWFVDVKNINILLLTINFLKKSKLRLRYVRWSNNFHSIFCKLCVLSLRGNAYIFLKYSK